MSVIRHTAATLAIVMIALIGGVPPGIVARAADAGNRVAIVPFGKLLGTAQTGDPNRVLHGGQTLDPVATSELRAALSKVPYVVLVDQAHVDGQLAPPQPGGTAAPAGPSGWEALTDWLVTGDVTYTTSREYEEESYTSPSGNYRTRRVPVIRISTSMSVQMTDVRTHAAYSHLATTRRSVKGRGSVGISEQEAAVRESFTEAAGQLAREIAGHIEFSGAVLSVERTVGGRPKTILVIGLGQPSGVQSGMEFTIVRSGGTITDPATGQQKALPGRVTGRCRVTEPGTETSYAELKSGDAAPGDRVVLDR